MSKSGIFCMERGDEKEDGLMPLHFSKFDSIHGGVLGGSSRGVLAGPLGRGGGGWHISEGGGGGQMQRGGGGCQMQRGGGGGGV